MPQKQLLMEKFKSNWSNDVMSQNKLDVYRLVKQNFCAENYVKLNFKKQIHSVITQLRAGCLPIEIELGRYQNIPRDQRLCKQCTQNHIENELHFIIYCPKFDQIRHDLLTSLNKYLEMVKISLCASDQILFTDVCMTIVCIT